ncbi:MAG: hypothetical protein FJX65_10830 [Alphaproteobacteria bacterium]|nr:hypothetical protein [Alphaproteobacteria bacterium]
MAPPKKPVGIDVAFNVCLILGVALVAFVQSAGYLQTDNIVVLGVAYLIGVLIGLAVYRIYRLIRYGERSLFGD